MFAFKAELVNMQKLNFALLKLNFYSYFCSWITATIFILRENFIKIRLWSYLETQIFMWMFNQCALDMVKWVIPYKKLGYLKREADQWDQTLKTNVWL